MADLVIDNMRDGYVELAECVLFAGKEVAPRGMKTRELQDFTFTLTNPVDSLCWGVGRKPKFAIGAAEAMCLVGGIGDPTLMTNVSGTFRRFMDGGQLHGAYGPRVRAQLPPQVNRLQRDPDSRQAVVTIWDPAYDVLDTRDVPCTIAFNFRVRDGALNMGAVMRSNDVFLGTPYDVFMFTQLQQSLARALEIPVGTYTHHAWSLHAYERNFEALSKLHSFDPDEHAEDLERNGVPAFTPRGFGYGGESTDQIMDRARQVHEFGRIAAGSSTVSEEWYIDILAPYERMTRIENFTS